MSQHTSYLTGSGGGKLLDLHCKKRNFKEVKKTNKKKPCFSEVLFFSLKRKIFLSASFALENNPNFKKIYLALS